MRALLHSDLLDAARRAELTARVSTKPGAPIGAPAADDPRGSGLGLTGLAGELRSGRNREGGAMGFRVACGFLPADDLAVIAALISAPNAAEDKIGELLTAAFEAARDGARLGAAAATGRSGRRVDGDVEPHEAATPPAVQMH